MSAVLLGVLLWSLVHYAGHRLWHVLRLGHVPAVPTRRVSVGFFTYGERQHHVAYPQVGTVPVARVDAQYLNPPIWEPLLLGALLSWAWPFLGAGFLVGLALDWSVHWWLHTAGRGWLARVHQRHHDQENGNFGMTLGLVWDRVCGTWLSR